MRTSSPRLFFLPGLALALLTGCVSVRLDQLPLTALKATLPEGPSLAPGGSAPLVVEATTQDGKTQLSKGKGNGKVPWDDFDIQASLVQVDRKGIVTLPADPRLSEGKLPHLRITAKGHPELPAELDVPVRYSASFVADFSGAQGPGGFDGQDGLAGSDGSSGSSDPNNPQAGGNGSDGSNGTDGGDGGNGHTGQAVQVWVTLKPGPKPLLQMRVAGPDREQFFLVDPEGGELLVKADGGPGGSGGQGGRGGRGGSGGSGSPSGSSGSSGMDGHSGWAGRQGDGGSITVFMDPQAEPYRDALRFSNKGSHLGPAPEIHEEAVAPLW